MALNMKSGKQADVKHGYCSSDVYTAKDSIALTRLMYDIRMSWNMIFDGETQV